MTGLPIAGIIKKETSVYPAASRPAVLHRMGEESAREPVVLETADLPPVSASLPVHLSGPAAAAAPKAVSCGAADPSRVDDLACLRPGRQALADRGDAALRPRLGTRARDGRGGCAGLPGGA